jgi:predicted phosphoribosyltransferase
MLPRKAQRLLTPRDGVRSYVDSGHLQQISLKNWYFSCTTRLYMAIRFGDRQQAGEWLAVELKACVDRPDVLVLALPRGGVPVGFALAHAPHVPLDIFLVRKLGVPGHEELAMGAIASGGVRVLNDDVVQALANPDALIKRVAAREQREIERREQRYRDGRPAPSLARHTIILVDDGLATGATMRAAAVAVRHQQPARVVIAVPTAAPETCAALQDEADEVICAMTPEPFYAAGLWYADFHQVADAEVHHFPVRAAQFSSATTGDAQAPQ